MFDYPAEGTPIFWGCNDLPAAMKLHATSSTTEAGQNNYITSLLSG
jgi:hypothetical protein